MAGAPLKPPAEVANFLNLDIRVGRVVEVQPFPKARNPSYKVAVDLGELGVKWSSAQITHYAREDLVGTLVVCVCNFPPRNIAGFLSEILILGARNADGNVIVLTPWSAVPPGETVY
ncbi:tRNA-binding protein [Nitrospirillum sp. BR 11828]|uniref:tRNA-binding protein n=1 Tax=Nitrospirillum sp. BR 11828 TaxID=3104325 RepID=UPI002ACACC41|nr:tRNA-binding protein [Nitrospirillum sp. BR 11828]MDZ5649693.1 tRNA-binding protein [Nitrospirillum sp. BR 11828]